jgi:hypothetical protein
MFDPLYIQVLAWLGLALLVLAFLFFSGIQKLVLELYAWLVRLALLGVVGAAAYLWFQPADLPVVVKDTLDELPRLRAILPETGTPSFGVYAATPLVFLLVPLLAILDVSRKLAGGRLRKLRTLTEEQKVVQPQPAQIASRPTVPVRRVDRKAAANTLAEAGSGKRANPAD